MENKISFSKIKNLFPNEEWDLGFLSSEELRRASLHPIKMKNQFIGLDFTNDIHFFGLRNSIVFAKKSASWDYTNYRQIETILLENKIENWVHIYTNFKEAAILAGLGVRAKNSLIYSYKFGFDCHFAVIGFNDELVDIPEKIIDFNLLKFCNGCTDCQNACPVKAIHCDKNEPYWLDSDKCDEFIGLSDHEKIPSIKKFWSENVYPEFDKEELKKIKTFFDTRKIFGSSFPFDRNGYYLDTFGITKNGEVINVPFCRECTSQKRCSKWNGNFPYDEKLK